MSQNRWGRTGQVEFSKPPPSVSQPPRSRKFQNRVAGCRDPYLTEIRSGQIRVTDSWPACNPLILNSSERRHLHRKIVELAREFSSVSRRVASSNLARGANLIFNPSISYATFFNFDSCCLGSPSSPNTASEDLTRTDAVPGHFCAERSAHTSRFGYMSGTNCEQPMFRGSDDVDTELVTIPRR